MPKQTFFNLSEDKKQRVLKAALDEFAEYTYYQASITRIVNRADIAKGSFYQYFQGKKDLYKYLVTRGIEKKRAYLEVVVDDLDQLDFFTLLRKVYLTGLQFGRDHPRLTHIVNQLLQGKDSQLKDEVLGGIMEESLDFFGELLAEGQQKGDIDPQINIDLVSYMVTTLHINLSDYFYDRFLAKEEEEIMEMVDDILYIIKNGIQNPQLGNNQVRE